MKSRLMNKPADKNYEQFRYGKTDEAEKWKVEMPKDEVEEIYSILAASKITIAPTSGFIGVEGPKSYRLIFNNGFNEVSYCRQGAALCGLGTITRNCRRKRSYVRIDG